MNLKTFFFGNILYRVLFIFRFEIPQNGMAGLKIREGATDAEVRTHTRKQTFLV